VAAAIPTEKEEDACQRPFSGLHPTHCGRARFTNGAQHFKCTRFLGANLKRLHKTVYSCLLRPPFQAHHLEKAPGSAATFRSPMSSVSCLHQFKTMDFRQFFVNDESNVLGGVKGNLLDFQDVQPDIVRSPDVMI
jgi:hypothetical protein